VAVVAVAEQVAVAVVPEVLENLYLVLLHGQLVLLQNQEEHYPLQHLQVIQ
jgi:hypothetical protein